MVERRQRYVTAAAGVTWDFPDMLESLATACVWELVAESKDNGVTLDGARSASKQALNDCLKRGDIPHASTIYLRLHVAYIWSELITRGAIVPAKC